MILAEGFEDIEAVSVLDILRRAEIEIVTASLKPGPVKSAHGVAIVPDMELSAVKSDSFDMLVLPGGLPGTTNLGADNRVLKIIQTMHKDNKYLAAICAAPTIFGTLGILADKEATCYPSMLSQLKAKKSISNKKVVVDGKIITSQGPATAMEFAYQLVAILGKTSIAEELKKGMLYI